MMKLSISGAAALLVLLAGSAVAQDGIHPVRYVHGGRCGPHQLGNPYTPQGDYLAWSAWRARGSWAEPGYYDPACRRAFRSAHHPSDHY
jgi:hypothetical protein